MNALIVGAGSDIAQHLRAVLCLAGWSVESLAHDEHTAANHWDLLIVANGTLEPIGEFFDLDVRNWAIGMYANGMSPLFAVKALWPLRSKGAKVVFMSGPNMAKPSPTYSAYRAGKAILESLVTTLTEETGHTFLMFAPGVVKTKIHQQTIKAGKRAANLERVKGIVDGTEPTVSMDEMGKKFMELIK